MRTFSALIYADIELPPRPEDIEIRPIPKDEEEAA